MYIHARIFDKVVDADMSIGCHGFLAGRRYGSSLGRHGEFSCLTKMCVY